MGDKKKLRKATANEKAILKAAMKDVKGKPLAKDKSKRAYLQRQLGERGVTEYKANRGTKTQGAKSQAEAAQKREAQFGAALTETKRGQKVLKKAAKSKISSPTRTYIKGANRFDFHNRKKK